MFTHGKQVTAALLAAMMLLAMALTAGSARVSLSADDGVEYETYTNEMTRFSLSYPAGSQVSEPYDNLVMFTVSDSFRVTAEYAYYTVGTERFVYSAADFTAMIADDAQVLADWVGVDAVTVAAIVRDEAFFRVYFATQISGEDWDGRLYIFDGQGEFGCYVLQGIIRDGADSACWDQLFRIAASFQVLEPYEAEDMTIYEIADWDMEVMLQNGNVGDIRFENSGGMKALTVVPGGCSESDAGLVMDQLIYDSSYSMEQIMNESADFILSKPDAQMISAPSTEAAPIGRYTSGMYMASYTDNGGTVIALRVFIPHGDDWWSISARSTEDALEPVMAAVSDMLFSLRFGGEPTVGAAESMSSAGGTADINKSLPQILDWIESQDNFYGGQYTSPIGCVSDVNGDGNYEFLALYETTEGAGAYNVMYEVWTIRPEGAGQLDQGVLFMEVGGNDGFVGLAEKDGVYYLLKSSSGWDGDVGTDVRQLIPLSGDETALLYDQALEYSYITQLIESDGGVGTTTTLYAGGEPVPDSELGRYSASVKPVLHAGLMGDSTRSDLTGTSRDLYGLGEAVSFDELRQHDFNADFGL